MTTTTESIWESMLATLEMEDDTAVPAIHLSEIEEEAENMLELLSVLRTTAYHNDSERAQETAAELTLALEHLADHIQYVLPQLQEQPDVEPEIGCE